jgi:hypothetical protein
MNWIQVFDVAWLTSILVLLLLIWRCSESRNKHVTAMEQSLVDVSTKNAESVRQAVQTTQEVIELLKDK